MLYVTVGLVLVGAVAVLNLLLTAGVIRRLREHTSILSSGAGPQALAPPTEGDPIGHFVTTAIDGETVSRDSLPSGSLAVFLSPGCGPCQEQLPALVRHLRESGRPREATLVVIAEAAGAAAEMIGELESLAIVVCEPPPATDIRAAFGVSSFPTALVVDGSTVTDVYIDLGKLPAPEQPAPEQPTTEQPATAAVS